MASVPEPYLSAFPDAIALYAEVNSWYRQIGTRPEEVHEDIWARYEAVAPVVRLNLGIASAYLDRDAAPNQSTTDFAAAAEGFRERNDPTWLVAEALAARGSTDSDVGSMAFDFVATTTAKPGSGFDRPRAIAPPSDVTILFALILLRAAGIVPPVHGDNRVASGDLAAVIGGVRTDDHVSELQYRHLRQMARNFNQTGWLASVRSLIVQTMRASSVDPGEIDVVRWMVAAEPPFDPLVVATCVAAAATAGPEWETSYEFVIKLRAAGQRAPGRHVRPVDRAFSIYCDAVEHLLT